jgi:hypothetical protein
MSHFLQQLDEALEKSKIEKQILNAFEDRQRKVKEREDDLDDFEQRLRAENAAFDLIMSGHAILLDVRKDPDPYGYHNIPLATRLQCMGWK